MTRSRSIRAQQRQKEKASCTPGVYIIKGKRGIRVGQSICPEKRAPRVAKQLEPCIGNLEKIQIIPALDRKQRLKLEKTLIDAFQPSCNPIRR